MYAARWILVSFLILLIIVTFSPAGREVASQAWKEIRPVVVDVMDSLYASLRNFVAGEDAHEGIDDHTPGVNFDLIITKDRGAFS
jgi:hypothetical protein